MLQPLWETIWRFLTKLNRLSPEDPVVTLLGLNPSRCKLGVNIKTYTRMFVAAFVTTVKSWRQPRHPLVGNGYIHFGPSRQWDIIQH